MNNKYDLENYTLGGYYIIAQSKRQEWMNDKVIPNIVLSASRCICENYPNIDIIWNKSEKKKYDYRKLLGLSIGTYEEMENWVMEGYQNGKFDYPDVFNTLESAIEFNNKFLINMPNLRVIGLGLPSKYTYDFLEDQNGYKHGVYNNIKKSLTINGHGKVLGYEILGYEYGSFHSYICNGIEDDYYERFKLGLNKYGFISDFGEADSLSEYTNQEIEGTEPVLWLPWIIAEYSK